MLPAGYIGLDASRVWLLFWIVHSLALLQEPLPPQVGRPALSPPDPGGTVARFRVFFR